MPDQDRGEPGTTSSSELRARAFAEHRAGRFLPALALYAEALAVSDDPAEIARITAGRASSHWARGEIEVAARLADEARATALTSGDDGALADAYVATALVRAALGDPAGNARAYEVALQHASAAGETETVVRILTNMASRLNDEGQHAAAQTRLEHALALLEHSGDQPSSGTVLMAALAHLNLGDAYLGLGRVAEALHEYQRAETGWLSQDSPMRAHASLGIGEAYRNRGLPTQAASAYRAAIAMADTTGSAQVLVPALAGLSRVRVEDDPMEARAALARCLHTPAALGDVTAHLAAGWLELDAGDVAGALHHARVAESEAGRRHNRAALADALELLALLEPHGALGRLAEARALWTEVDNTIGAGVNDLLRARAARDRDTEREARQALRAAGVSDAVVRIAGPLRAVGGVPDADLHVRVLGRLAVLRHGEPLPVWSWQSRKCRDVVKLLAAHPTGIGRDRLAQVLWPDEPRTAARLSVVLSTLRTLLDPGREHDADHLLVADRSTVMLHPENVEIDAVEFERRAVRALRAGRSRAAIAPLEDAAARYTGPFADDDPYAEWTGPVRSRLQVLAGELHRALADALLASGDAAAAVPWYLGLVTADPYDEPSHRGLLRALASERRHGQVRRHYAEYCAAMADLGEPAEPLTALLADPAGT